MTFPLHRGRRLRRTPALRAMARETHLSVDQLVAPLFVCEGRGVREPIASMPGHARLSPDLAAAEAADLARLGITSVLLFGIPSQKDAIGSGAWDPDGPVPDVIRRIKRDTPSLAVWADVCLCEYTDHGHCGILDGGSVDNDRHAAAAGAGRAGLRASRRRRDCAVRHDGRPRRPHPAGTRRGRAAPTAVIVSYAASTRSAFYGPFREAAGSTPQLGDRRGYQMDPPNVARGACAKRPPTSTKARTS